MKNILFSILTFLAITSCSSSKIIMYHYDNSRYDDAEIDDTKLHYFFNKKNTSIKSFSLVSNNLSRELNKIDIKIGSLKDKDEFDFGHYYYTFISKKDTLYSDYDLNYWRNKDKGVVYKLNSKVKEEIKALLIKNKEVK
ncbi:MULTISPECIES: hypothetical protein [unclassified Chryseobacterium]|uniref:hypothetical protein n=1 Tax=unclassified Chryseobacterium TaxID=2593645 RepID=UPI001623EFCB|nr:MULTISPECIES: hypothetical protein [unclassified Chryseobacterium]MCY1660976.1 hypothetical protein [Chryseobacterium sp. SL1]